MGHGNEESAEGRRWAIGVVTAGEQNERRAARRHDVDHRGVDRFLHRQLDALVERGRALVFESLLFVRLTPESLDDADRGEDLVEEIDQAGFQRLDAFGAVNDALGIITIY